MGRSRNPTPTRGNQPTSRAGARAPAYKTSMQRSAPSSSMSKTAKTFVTPSMHTTWAAPSARGKATPNIRAANANRYSPYTAMSAQSQRGHSSGLTPAKIQSRGGGQGKPVRGPHEDWGKAAEVIQRERQSQRDNINWHDRRENHITASVAHKIANSNFVNDRSSEVPQSYLKAVMKQSSCRQTPAMTWGIDNEKRAVQEYQHLKSRNPRSAVKVEECGLFIHPKKTWLAASPDGIVTNQSTGKTIGLLEVKCPYKHKDNTIREACKDDTFCLTPAGKSYVLKKDHPYYTQVQTQMATTGAKKTDLVVYTKKETAIAPVKFDAKFWKATEPKLERFYAEAVIPHLEKINNPEYVNEWKN